MFFAVNLSTDTVNKLRIYQENFEQVYISSAVEFYTAQASAYLNENGIQNYMKYVRNTYACIKMLNISQLTLLVLVSCLPPYLSHMYL